MFSVFSVLRETLYLWRRNFWTVTALTLICGLPQMMLEHSRALLPKAPSLSLSLSTFFSVLLSIGVLPLLDAMRIAALLGLLTKTEDEPSLYSAILRAIRNYTWTLFRLVLLISVCVVVGCGLLAFVLRPVLGFLHLNGNQIGIIVFTIYLVLVKYALANPLVVLEGQNARQALRQSWKMTQGHFWCVAGCYIFLGAASWVIRWMLTGTSSEGTGFISAPLPWLASEFFEPIWIILGLCLYRRIRAAELSRS